MKTDKINLRIEMDKNLKGAPSVLEVNHNVNVVYRN